MSRAFGGLQCLGDGHKLVEGYGRLRNSTKIAAQFFGLEQCSPKTPATLDKLKQWPDGHQGTAIPRRLSCMPGLVIYSAEPQHEAFEIVPGLAIGKALDAAIHPGGLFQQQGQGMGIMAREGGLHERHAIWPYTSGA